jgi:hypothetical protein
MDFVAQILESVRTLLAFLGEFKASGIVDIIAQFFGSMPF